MRRFALHLSMSVLGLASLAEGASAQAAADTVTTAEKADALSSVIHARNTRFRDTTLFDACSVTRALGGGEDAMRALREPEQRFVAAGEGAPCGDPESSTRGIQVMEIVPSGSGMRFAVTVRLRVWTGPRRYAEETYFIRMPNHGAHRDPNALWTVSLIQLHSETQLP